MTAPLLHIDTQTELPETADCVVIGAGIVGTSAAYWLARAGLKVVLLERAASVPNSRAATGAGAASRTAMPANCRSRPKAWRSGKR